MNRRLARILFVLVILAVGAPRTLAGSIEHGPYIQNLTADSVTICWETLSETEGTIEYWEAADVSTAVVSNQPSKTFHEAAIVRLKPATEYKYRITIGKDTEEGVFRTAPETFEPFTFIAYGDSRSGHDIHKKLISLMEPYNPALILNSGDLVGDGREQTDWDVFWGIVEPIARGVPYYPCLGNHEENSALYYKYFSLPDSGIGEANYAFSYSGAFFLVLDTNDVFGLVAQQKKWIKEQLQRGQAYDFIFVMFHQPMYSSSKRPENTSMQKTLGPIFEKAGVSAVINGHDHFYERSEADGIQYIVAGGGGAPLYDFINIRKQSLVRKMENHFLVISINGKNANIKTVNIDNKIIDEVELKSPRG
jgi:hypothetical protein